MLECFQAGELCGYGFGLCMFIFFNAIALYESVKKCHRIWTHLILVNIIAGIIAVPIFYTIIIPVVYLIKSRNTFIKKGKKTNIKKILKELNPLK